MRCDCVVKYADVLFVTLNYQPIQFEEATTHHNKTFVMANKLDWTKMIFEDANHPEILDMILIEYTGEREEFDVHTLLKKRSIIQH